MTRPLMRHRIDELEALLETSSGDADAFSVLGIKVTESCLKNLVLL
jgi:hypothetical protein